MTGQPPTHSDLINEPIGSLQLGQDVFSSEGQRVGTVAGIEPDALVVSRGPLQPPERRIPRTLIAAVDPRGVRLGVPLAQLQAEAPVVQLEAVQAPPAATAMPPPTDDGQVLELKEERLVPRTELRQVGEVEVRTVVEEIPSRLEVETVREEVIVEHVPIGQSVEERVAPWEDHGTLVIPVYEEQLVVMKRLVLKEELRVRRVRATERQAIEERVRRERAVIDDLNQTGLVHERYTSPDTPVTEAEPAPASRDTSQNDDGLGGLLKKVLG